MAAPAELRSARRRALTAAIPTPNSLVAASSPVANAGDVFKKNLNGPRDAWQDEAWQLFDEVGELGVYIRWRARSCSRVKLVASEIDPDTGQPTGGLTTDKNGNVTGDAAKVAAIVRSIAGGPLGQAEFIETAVTILGVPGEFFTAILNTAEGKRWLAVSRQQIKRSPLRRNPDGSEALTITLPEGGEHDFNPGNGDAMFRVWNPHPRIPTEADSPVRAGLSPLREIARTTEKIEDADRSRMATNGILILPMEADLPGGQGPTAADKPDGTPDTAPRYQTSRSLQEKLVAANDLGLMDKKASVRIAPLVLKAPGEFIDKIRHVDLSKAATEFELRKRDSAVLRWCRVIDMEPDQLLGLGDTNHWNGHLLADQDVNLHVNPVMKTLCQALWRNVIRPTIVSVGIDPDKYVLTIDASDLTADPDKTDEAKDANAVGALTNKALLKHLRLPEDDGYTNDLAGLQQRAWDQINQATPENFVKVVREVAPILGATVQGLSLPEPVSELPAGRPRSTYDEDETHPVDGSPPPTEGKAPRKPVTAAVVVAPVDIAADFYLTAAMRLAGNRRVKTNDREQRARLRDVEPHDYYRLLPPVDAADVGRLIASFDAGLDEKATKYGFDADEVRARVTAEARRRLTSQVVDG